MQRIQVCTVGDVDEGGMLQVDIGSEKVAIYRVGDVFFATSDTCTHGQSSLVDEGELHGFEIECGWHFGRFDIRTGEVLQSPCNEALRTYPVAVEGGAVFVEVEPVA